jgi:hypothetical protein
MACFEQRLSLVVWQVASQKATDSFTRRDVHQVEGKLHAAARVAFTRTELQKRDQGSHPEAFLAFQIDDIGDQLVIDRSFFIQIFVARGGVMVHGSLADDHPLVVIDNQ